MKKTYTAPALTVLEVGCMTPIAESLQIDGENTLNPVESYSVKSPWQLDEAPTATDDEDDDTF